MHKKQKQRIEAVFLVLLGIGTAVALSLTALKQTVTFFYSPSDIKENRFTLPDNRPFRLGGLVDQDSVKKQGLTTTFTVTDGAHKINVKYEGILPDLFKEGQGVVALGVMDSEQNFIASELLAKHDENYMPPEVQKALEEAGHPVKK